MDINPGGMGVYHLKKPKQVTIKLRNNGNSTGTTQSGDE
jgi:hypothetical protein